MATITTTCGNCINWQCRCWDCPILVERTVMNPGGKAAFPKVWFCEEYETPCSKVTSCGMWTTETNCENWTY